MDQLQTVPKQPREVEPVSFQGPEHLLPMYDCPSIHFRVYRSSYNNSISSPLLRLPGEIRNKIYKYALGGMRIKFSWDPNSDRLQCESKPANTSDTYCAFPDHIRYDKYALPRSCRQIYAETSTLLFQLNILEFDSHNAICSFAWNLRPSDEQLIRAIKPPQAYVSWVLDGTSPLFTTLFPNLKELYFRKYRWSSFDIWPSDELVAQLMKSEREDLEIIVEGERKALMSH